MTSPDDSLRPADHGQRNDLLTGWKEIAAYIGKGERTAMRWEKTIGLPVHRMTGQNGDIVSARRSEIDRWREAREATMPQPSPVHADAAERAAMGRLRNPWLMAVAAVVSALAVGWRALDGRPEIQAAPANPTSWDVEGSTLWVRDEGGNAVFHKSFPFSLSEAAYADPAAVSHPPPMVRIVDLDGDGTKEVLFVVTSTSAPEENKLYCFEADGSIRFVWIPEASVRFGRDWYGPPFGVRYLLVTENDDRRTRSIWLGASHRQWFPTVVQKLDRRGQVQDTFWTNGHLRMLTEGRVGHRRVVFAGGTNNDSGGAALAVLDYDHPAGRAPAVRAEFLCSNCEQRDPLAFMVFPSTPLSRQAGERPTVEEVRPQPDGGLWVAVGQFLIRPPEGPGAIRGVTYYRFGPDLSLVGGELGDDYLRADRLLNQGPLVNPPLSREEPAILYPVRAWDGSAMAPLARPSTK